MRIGCPGSIAASVLPVALESFSRNYPRVVLQLDEVPAPSNEFPSLHERRHDLVIARVARPLADERDLNVEVLFQDPLVIATGIDSPWARRRKVDLAELASAKWILTAPHTWVYVSVARAFAARKLPMPPP